MTSLVTCPLDVVKTRMQNLFIPRKPSGSILVGSLPPQQPLKQIVFLGTWASLKKIWAREGLRGLYRGLTPTLIGYLPTFGIYFPAYFEFKRLWSNGLQRAWNDPVVHLASAICAGACSSFTTNPLWLVRTRLMTQSKTSAYHYTSVWDALRKIVKNEGVKGLYKGLTPAALGLFHVAIQFPIYEKVKEVLQIMPRAGDGQQLQALPLGTLQILLASTSSKVVATTTTYPTKSFGPGSRTRCLKSTGSASIRTFSRPRG